MAQSDRSEQLGLPDLDAPDGEIESPSGLGKGLAAIIPQLAGLDDEPPPGESRSGLASLIPGAADGPDPDRGPDRPEESRAESEPDTIRQLRDDLVQALLDGLEKTIRLDLCAYVHQGPTGGPELFLRAPALSALGPRRAWYLFGALRTAAAAERGDEQFDAAGLRGLSIATGGPRSSGVFALARADGLTEREHAVARRFCLSFGRAVHQLAESEPRVTEAEEQDVPVEIHETRDSILARALVDLGGRQCPGSGRADTRVEAVTRAVMDAHPFETVFRYASEVSLGGEHAAVVLLESPSGSVALGSAVTGEGDGRATARAALRAAAGLAG